MYIDTRIMTVVLLSVLTMTALAAHADPIVTQMPGDGGERDQAMLALLPDASIDFVAEARGGNNSSGGGDHELNLHVDDPGLPLVTRQASWSNGAAYAFEVVYTLATGQVDFTIGGQTLSASGLGKFGEIYIRTRAASAQSSTRVDNMVLTLDSTSYTIGDSSHAWQSDDGNTVNDRDILRITGLDDYATATLRGDITFSWLAGTSMPSASRLDAGIKFGNDIPEPATMSLLLVGGVGLLARRKRTGKAA